MAQLQARIWAHFERGGEGAPVQADKPGDVNSGEHPTGGVWAFRNRCAQWRWFLRFRRCAGQGISDTILREGLRREQARV